MIHDFESLTKAIDRLRAVTIGAKPTLKGELMSVLGGQTELPPSGRHVGF
jgi:hypothetical protein